MIDYTIFFQTIFWGMGFFFSLWPLVILSPLQRRRHILFNMTLAWGIMAIVWIASLFSPTPRISFLIPEPLNTILFFVSGLALLAVRFGMKYWRQRNLQAKADKATEPDDLLELSPTEFENMVVELYSALGHKAHRTGATGDHGIDVIVEASNGEKWIVQCKRWRGYVGEPVVRDFYGAMHHEKADKGAIITTGVFTPQARAWAKGKPITLLEGNEFFEYLKKARALAKGASALKA